jgi:hypothetical protein
MTDRVFLFIAQTEALPLLLLATYSTLLDKNPLFSALLAVVNSSLPKEKTTNAVLFPHDAPHFT